MPVVIIRARIQSAHLQKFGFNGLSRFIDGLGKTWDLSLDRKQDILLSREVVCPLEDNLSDHLLSPESLLNLSRIDTGASKGLISFHSQCLITLLVQGSGSSNVSCRNKQIKIPSQTN